MASSSTIPSAVSVGGRSVPWALAGFATVLAASCAGELSGNLAWHALAAVLFTLGLAAGWRHWIGRASGRVALVVALGTMVVGAALALPPAVIAGAAARLSGVVVLMLCVALLRPIFADRRLDGAIAALLARVSPPLRPAAILLASCASALGLSFGAVGVLGASLEGRAAPARIAACATMRRLTLSMLLGPSTASVAAVMATYPSVSWIASLSIGLPLALVGGILGAVLARPLAMEAVPERGGNASIAIAILLAELAATLFTHLVLGLSMTLAISVASAAVALACMLFWSRHDLGAALDWADEQIHERWTLIMPESALFLSCGLLAGLMQVPEMAGAAKAAIAFALPSGSVGIATLLVVVPLVTVAGIHPIVPFALLAPIVSAAGLGITELGLYAMWIVAFMLSMLLSPVSVLTMVTSANFRIPGRRLGLRANGLYAAALAGASAVMIGLCCAA